MKTQIAKYAIVTSTFKRNKRWYKIRINGEKTNYDVDMDGNVRNRETGETVTEDSGGNYCTYRFYVNGKKIHISKHRLLACIFIPIPKELRREGYDQMSLVPNHKDGNKHNNDLSNLEWVTPKGNMDHALETGLCDSYIGEKSHLATITKDQAIEICELLSTGHSPREVSDITGIRIKVIRHIYSYESWKQISKNYNFHKSKENIPYMYDDDLIHAICKDIEKGIHTNRYIADKYDVSEAYVGDIKAHKRRTEISSQYNF